MRFIQTQSIPFEVIELVVCYKLQLQFLFQFFEDLFHFFTFLINKKPKMFFT